MKNDPQVAIFERTKKGLEALRELALQNKPIKITKHATHHKLPTSLGTILDTLGVWQRESNGMGKRGGVKVQWTYKNNGNDVVDNKLVQRVLDEGEKKKKEYAENKKNAVKAPRQITSAIKSTKKIEPEKLAYQLSFLKRELEKNELANGYLRPETVTIYNEIIFTLESVEEMKNIVVGLNKGLNEFINRF